MSKINLRQFKALKTIYSKDDGGVASFTFRVKSLEKDKIYTEQNPEFIEGNRAGVVIDDNRCWWIYDTPSFKDRFLEL